MLPPVVTTVAPRLAIREAGTYRISGMVRLEQPQVEISGDMPTQRISSSGQPGATTPFATYAYLGGPGLTPEILVRGGHIESLSVTPVDFQ
jgi:hypothetical protein